MAQQQQPNRSEQKGDIKSPGSEKSGQQNVASTDRTNKASQTQSEKRNMTNESDRRSSQNTDQEDEE